MMRAMAGSSDDGALTSGGSAGDDQRPGRAELRRAAEAEAAKGHAVSSRSERRRLEELRAKERRAGRSLWRAWWLYPLVLLIAVFVYLGLQSSSNVPPPAPQISQISNEP